ncbi:tyrosine-type recombinase/integrase [Methylophaga muralis]|uniref:Putative prophage CPS-53 integrase n=1 Tax=Methylophaga muralis TaxID=291169 RepID=A0A1E3GUT7_9GAMM|nr:integrase arm-type DNA-binding domain-containing protein [Methylophaga muralis]ODN67832.1 putative prophage CPS-53 integrase [Methylophaga muralis]
MLTDVKIKALKPKDKLYAVSDEKGLYLEVSTTGGKWWRFKYRFDGKQKRLSVGTYPDVGLKQAREQRDQLRKQIANGVDPSDIRKAEKLSNAGQLSFEFVAREWHQKFKHRWSEKYSLNTINRLEREVFPFIGSKNINDIKAPELLAVLRRMEARGILETAHRVHQKCGQIFRYAVATGRAERDPSTDLKGALPSVKVKHHASIIEPQQIGGLLRAINGYSGAFVTICALRLAPLVFVRPGELRHAEWTEFDLEKAEWRIPAEKMKMASVHIVPLSKQAITVIETLKPLTGSGKYLFPSIRTITRPMSENTVNGALRRLGYTGDEMVGHGFRSMASTILNEQGWNRDAIERQLAHSERDGVRAAYNYAEYLPERKRMMQSWADYLDGLAAGADVIAINKYK